MEEKNKIKITYEDLSSPKLDDFITQKVEKSTSVVSKNNLSIKSVLNSYNYIKWLYLFIVAILCFFIVLLIVSSFSSNDPQQEDPHKNDNQKEKYTVLSFTKQSVPINKNI